MDIGKLTYLLFQGFVLGAGPCMLICAPILLPYIAGTKKTWQEGLQAALIFGFTRAVIYSLLGGAVGYVGYYLFGLFYSQMWGRSLWGIAGLFIILLGILIALGKGVENPLCRLLRDNSAGNMVVLGVVIGLSPCLPLLAVLTEIMFMARNFHQGFLYGFSFGIGTLLSPLLLLSAAAPLVSEKIIRNQKLINLLCGILLVGVGLYIIIR